MNSKDVFSAELNRLISLLPEEVKNEVIEDHQLPLQLRFEMLLDALVEGSMDIRKPEMESLRRITAMFSDNSRMSNALAFIEKEVVSE